MRLTAAALVLILVPQAGRAAEWKTMTNDRFGFVIDVPASYKASPPPANGDGLRFSSPDRRSEVAAYGHLFEPGTGMVRDENLQAVAEAQDGLRLTYQQASGRSYTLTGLKGDRIVYIHAVSTCDGQAAAVVRAEYPAADKKQMDETITHMVGTLRGSSGC